MPGSLSSTFSRNWVTMMNAIGTLLVCGLVLVSAVKLKDGDVLLDYKRLMGVRSLGVEFGEHFRNASLTDLAPFQSRIPSQEDLLCLADMARFMQALSAGELWALRMIDAWGSIPSGVLYGNFIHLGNFDECIKISKEITNSHSINGKYCFLTASLGEMLGVQNIALTAMPIKIASCFPASCSAAHMDTFVAQLMQRLLNTSSTGLQISESSCQTSESEPWDGLTIFTVVIIGVMGSIVTLCTLYDYFFSQEQNEGLPKVVNIFSARASSRAIFRVVENKSNPNVINCLHGIRCMSLFWVVFGHDYVFHALISPNINSVKLVSWAEQPFSSFILHGVFSVDSFFFLGGLLVAMVALRSMDKSQGNLNAPLMYLHRLIRIVPVLAMAILVYMKLMPVVSGGPMFSSGYSGSAVCESGWYWTLLFVQNYAASNICLAHSWYLAVDMQLYIISPLLLIALYKWGKKAAAGIVVLVLLLSACLFATMMINDYSLLLKNLASNGDANKKLYFATHRHAAPWLIGFLFGYFLHVNRGKKFQLGRIAVWSGWLLSLAMIFTSIFAMFPASKWSAPPVSTLEESLYYTLTRVGWPLALCWIVFACMQGHGGLANSFLSSPLWQPLSRLSYSVYIWHMFLLEVNARNTRTSTYFSDYTVMLKFWSDFGFTVLVAYVFYLIIEAPFGGLDSFLRPKANAVAPVTRKPEDAKETKILGDISSAEAPVVSLETGKPEDSKERTPEDSKETGNPENSEKRPPEDSKEANTLSKISAAD